MKRVLGTLIWVAIAALGAAGFGALALSRGETISAAWILIAGVCSYLVAYRFYARFIAHNVFEDGDSVLSAAGVERLLRFRDALLGLIGHGLREPGTHLGLRQGADELVDNLAVRKQLHGRDATDAVALRDLRVLVGVDLGQGETGAVFAGNLFENGAQLAAGAAPLSPEVDQHRTFAAGFQDLLLEIGYVDGHVWVSLVWIR